MWKIMAALLVATSGISDASNLNSTLLETKITSLIGHTRNGIYEVLNANEYKYLISIGDVIDKKRDLLVHRCIGIMLSDRNALTVEECAPPSKIASCSSVHEVRSEDVKKYFFKELYATFQRTADMNDHRYPIDKTAEKRNLGISLAIITFAEPVSFITESTLPVFLEKNRFQVDSMIGWNNLEGGNPILTGRPFIKIPVVVTDDLSCEANQDGGQFCIKPVHEGQAINMNDPAGPVLYKGAIVGMLIRMEKNCGVAVRVVATERSSLHTSVQVQPF